MGGAWLGLGFGLLLTLKDSPDGQKIFFWTIGLAQISTLAVILYYHFVLSTPTIADDALIVSLLTLYIYCRIL